ncbi:MAG: Fe-S cluster assembly protein SufD [Pseudomonadota bacterium]
MSTSVFINPTAFEAGLEAAYRMRSTTSETQTAAFERFAKLGLPNRRVEGWKWSDFHNALRTRDIAAGRVEGERPSSAFDALNPVEFLIEDGRIHLPEGAAPSALRFGVVDPVGTIAELEAHSIVALNVAMTRKALGVEIADGAVLDRPVHIRHINTGAGQSFAQTLVRVGKGADVTLIETYEGRNKGFYSHLNHMAVRDGAKIRRYVLQNKGADCIIHGVCAAKVEAAANFSQTSLSTGAGLSRHETIVHFWGDDAAANLNSAALVADKRHADFTSIILHKEESGTVRQLHKGVATDRGRAIFQGKFEVERKAQKTDAQMTANALLLTDGAEANHKPELEIYADDVECAHGSTCGALDSDALFYLRQRGLSATQARALLIEAFAGEAIAAIDRDDIRSVFEKKLNDWLEAHA